MFYLCFVIMQVKCRNRLNSEVSSSDDSDGGRRNSNSPRYVWIKIQLCVAKYPFVSYIFFFSRKNSIHINVSNRILISFGRTQYDIFCPLILDCHEAGRRRPIAHRNRDPPHPHRNLRKSRGKYAHFS